VEQTTFPSWKGNNAIGRHAHHDGVTISQGLAPNAESNPEFGGKQGFIA